ncbi:hypothetical protein M9H77_32423 [Catharanthus roseus]|uniref:Uncharacterized protein n=1 Tax=Catharanthus roseus TaxID=4058 RepID=A0ACC0A3T9_CATRO|nr:hypothetical protein M9H77_32423 [Catharanthus roseus]
MDMDMDILLCISLMIFSIFFLQIIFKKQKNKLPPSPPSLPIIGHLHLLKRPFHRTLRNLSAKYGPIVYLRLGSRPTVLVSSPSIVEECFTKKNDIILSNRPHCILADYLTYNHTTITFSSYGDHLRNLRRVITNRILCSAALNNFAAVRAEEIHFSIGKLFLNYKENKKINLSLFLNELLMNVFMKVLIGKKTDSEGKDLFSGDLPLHICDFIPVLRKIGYGGFEKMVKSFSNTADKYLQGLVDESRREIKTGGNKTVLQLLLSLQETEPDYYTDDIIKGILQEIIGGGPDTSASVIIWAMTLLLNHPEVMEKVKNEIDFHVTSERLIEESDLFKLSYLRSLVNETLRLFPGLPLLLPRLSSDDCTIGGYHIPRGTMVLVNAWAIHRDPNTWDEPEKFKPERFDGIKKEFEGFKFVPFGMGRRPCPGAGMATRIMGLIIGTLIQCFEWQRIGHDLLDMEEGSGLVLPKVKPLEAFYKPRPSMQSIISQL